MALLHHHFYIGWPSNHRSPPTVGQTMYLTRRWTLVLTIFIFYVPLFTLSFYLALALSLCISPSTGNISIGLMDRPRPNTSPYKPCARESIHRNVYSSPSTNDRNPRDSEFVAQTAVCLCLPHSALVCSPAEGSSFFFFIIISYASMLLFFFFVYIFGKRELWSRGTRYFWGSFMTVQITTQKVMKGIKRIDNLSGCSIYAIPMGN